MDIERTQAAEKCMLYKVTDLEPILGVSAQQIKRYIKSGKLEANKIAGKWRINQQQLERFVNGETQDK